MGEELELPQDVTAAIHANRKIEAIKLLRGHQGLDLKEAKDRVDEYTRRNPHLISKRHSRSESGIGRLLVLGLFLVLIYAAWRIFSMEA